MANPGTRFNKIVSVGAPLSSFAALAATVMLYIYGGVTVHGVLNFEGTPAEITQSGSTSVSITGWRHEVTPLLATGATATVGANGKYATGRWQNPKTQTAALLDFCLNVYTTPNPATTTSCFINHEDTAGSGGSVYIFKNKALTRGSLCFTPSLGVNNSGAYLPLIGPTQQIKCSNSLGAGSGAGLVGDMSVIYRTNRL